MIQIFTMVSYKLTFDFDSLYLGKYFLSYYVSNNIAASIEEHFLP